jgi:hypothetical protein
MSKAHRFELVYSKIQEVLEGDVRRGPRTPNVQVRHSTEVSREELDEIARLREIILEASAPDPISFTTT